MLSVGDDTSDDDMLLLPSPRKASPVKASAVALTDASTTSTYRSPLPPSPSHANSKKRSRSDAFEMSSPVSAANVSEHPALPHSPIVDPANPFLSPTPKAPAAADPDTMLDSPSTGIASNIDALSIHTPISHRKRAREVFNLHGGSPDRTPLKSCLSSSSGSGSSPSSGGDAESPRKRVHWTSSVPPPPPDEEPAEADPSSEPSSPPSASSHLFLDIKALARRKLKSPRKRVVSRPMDGSILTTRDGGRAVKRLEGLTVPKPFGLSGPRNLSSVSGGLSALSEERSTKNMSTSTTARAPLSSIPAPRAPSSSQMELPVRIRSRVPSAGSSATTTTSVLTRSTSKTSLPTFTSSRTGAAAGAAVQSGTSRIPQATASIAASSSSTSTAAPRSTSVTRSSSRLALSSAASSLSLSSISSLATSTSGAPSATVSSKAAAATLSQPAAASSLNSSTRTKPLYPNSLGVAPAASRQRPTTCPTGTTTRKTSVPVSAPTTTRPASPSRSVSDPFSAKAPAVKAGISSETRTAMAGLAESLAKMKVRKSLAFIPVAADAGGVDIASSPSIVETVTQPLASAKSRPSFPPPARSSGAGRLSTTTSVASRRQSSVDVHDDNRRSSTASVSSVPAHNHQDPSNTASVSLTSSKSTSSLGVLSQYTEPRGNGGVLQGVVAYVDVRTAEGDEAGGLFAEILRSLGAKVRLAFSIGSEPLRRF